MSIKHDFLNLRDLSKETFLHLLCEADAYRTGQYDGAQHRPLNGKTLAMLFAKPSTRTRVSFEVGVFQLGGHAIMLSDRDSQIGRGEPISDTAKVLSGYVDGIMIRTFDHEQLLTLARHASVPVINGLTDFNHPCQVMADLLTCRTEFGEAALSSMKVAWIGDGNNMACSWVNASEVLGFELRISTPKGYELSNSLIENARANGARIVLSESPSAAAEGADVVTTDVWASMGQEAEAQSRQALFMPFQVDQSIMELSAQHSIFLHCLPAHRGEEATAEVVDGARSRIWNEAQNRLYAQKAIMNWAMGNND